MTDRYIPAGTAKGARALLKYSIVFIILIAMAFYSGFVRYAPETPAAESPARWAAEGYHIFIRPAVYSVPLDLLKAVTGFIKDPSAKEKYLRMAEEHADAYLLSADELFELLAVSSDFPERQEFLQSYAGREILVSYENGNILVSGAAFP